MNWTGRNRSGLPSIGVERQKGSDGVYSYLLPRYKVKKYKRQQRSVTEISTRRDVGVHVRATEKRLR